MPELLADARGWLWMLLLPRDPVEGCEHENGSQRDPTVERGRFCIHMGSQRSHSSRTPVAHKPTRLPNRIRRNAEASPLSIHEVDSGVSKKLLPPKVRKT